MKLTSKKMSRLSFFLCGAIFASYSLPTIVTLELKATNSAIVINTINETLDEPQQHQSDKGSPTLKPNYSVIEQTGKFCPGRDSCKHRVRNGRGVGSGTGRITEGVSGPFKHARGGTLNSRGPFGIENDWKKRNWKTKNRCRV